jgi:hypothetical protein
MADQRKRSAIALPATLAADLEPLRAALGDVFAVDGGPPSADADVVLVDLRDGDAVVDSGNRPTRTFVVVADEASRERLEVFEPNVLLVIAADWSPAFAVAAIERALTAWNTLCAAHADNLKIIEVQKAVVEHSREILALREELDEHHADLTVKNDELRRLNNFKAGVLKRLGDPSCGYIADVLRDVKAITGQRDVPESLMRPTLALGETAQKITHIFEPYDFYARAELALHGKSVVAVVRNARARTLMARALIATGASVELFATVESVEKRLSDRRPVDVLFADWDNQAVLNRAEKLRPNLHTVLMTSQPVFEHNGQAMMELPLSNVLISNELGDSSSHDPVLVQELVVTAGKLLSGDIFGLEKYLAWGTRVTDIRVERSTDRPQLLREVAGYARRCGLRRAHLRNMKTLVDELLMNAIWDAPVDAAGQPKYIEKPRSQPVDLLPHEAPILRYGSDGNLLGISVTDPFGRLDREIAFRYLLKCFAGGKEQIDDKAGGAGLGLFYAFMSVSTLIINVAPGLKTEVIGLLNMNLTPKETWERTRSYHYFRAAR